MIHRIRLALALVVVALLALSLTGCTSAVEFCAYMAKAAADFTVQKLGTPPSQPSQSSDCKGNTSSPDPLLQSQGLSPARPDTCDTPYDGADACVACIRSHCCTEFVACTHDYTCACTIARAEGKIDVPEEADCGDADDITGDAIACQAEHCADVCLTAEGG